MLQLQRTPEQEQALQQFIQDLHDPASPLFHHWITAAKFGERYGAPAAGISRTTEWLESHGFKVNLVYPNHMVIDFSGTAGQVRQALHTEIHHLLVKGQAHIANMSDPQIPAALASTVAGVVSLNDFRPRPMLKQRSPYTVGNGYALVAPADLATIYNFNPAFAAGISGQGQTIVLIEDTDVYSTADWNTFRSVFGLATAYPQGSLAQVHPASARNNCTDPGYNGDDIEAALDVEWASAAAPSAAIQLASCADTYTNFGGFIALQNLLNASGTPPAIVSISYGESESYQGASYNAYISSLYAQGVTEGVSIFVSSGDEGAASSDADEPYAVSGITVSGFTSTPYNVSVGGTDFGDTYQGAQATYWNSANTATYGSALSYIPEIPWNDSCASVLIGDYNRTLPVYGSGGLCGQGYNLTTASGSGGPSGCGSGAPDTPGVVSGTCAGYPKPAWQSGLIGNPSDGVRDIPDVSLFAANGAWGHYYAFCFSDPSAGYTCTGAPDTWAGAGGTSFAAPIMAGVQSLVNQASGTRWGNPNPSYYSLAQTKYGSGGSASCSSALGRAVGAHCIFYDVTPLPLLYAGTGSGGDIDVPCLGVNCYAPSGTYGVLSTSPQGLSSVSVTGMGYGYTTAPSCTLSGGGGSGAACSASLTGVVTSVSLTNGGSGYTTYPVSCTLAGGGGTGASCEAYICTNNEVCVVDLTTFGSGYTSNPTCTLTGGGGTGATCTATEARGISTSLTAAGSGYTTMPPCTLGGGGGSGGTCAALAVNSSDAYQPAFGTTTGWDFATGIGTVNVSNLVASFGSSAATLSPLSLTFSSQPLSTTSAAASVTLTNTGASRLSILTVGIGGANASDFAKSADTCTGATVVPSGTCTVGVTFGPTAAGARTGTLTITDNSNQAASSTQTASLTGTGSNPAPTITSLSPASTTAGAAAQTLTINGTNFLSTSTVTYHGVTHNPTLISSTQLKITLSTSDQAAAGTDAVVVTNAGGSASNSVNFAVNNAAPSLSSLAPASATTGAAAQTLTINGTKFLSTSTVTYHGVTHNPTLVSATQLKITLSANDLATAGTDAVVVSNPAPGGGASNAVNFNVNNGAPSLGSLAPASATAGAAAQTLTINGTNFLSASTVTYHGVAHTPTLVSSTQLKITLGTSDQATAGMYAVVVTNAAPGGGASNAANFTVNNGAPSLTGLSPASATAGAAAQTLTISGTNFVSTSTVTYHGAAHTPTFVGSTQLKVTLSTSDQATAGSYAVVVTNPAPGGGVSNSVNLNVNNGAPSISSLSPASATAGAAAQTLTINGTKFLSTSTVTYHGVAHIPTSASSTQLKITLSKSDQAAAGTYAVVVSNPAPGGGASNLVNFTVNSHGTGLSPTGK
jgi:hypothetical protein